MENLIQSFPTPVWDLLSLQTMIFVQHKIPCKLKAIALIDLLLLKAHPFSLAPPLAFKIFISDPPMDRYFCGDPP